MLQVGVHHRDRVAAGAVQPGQHRRLVAEVARKRQQPDARIFRMQFADNTGGGVGGAVVHNQQLQAPCGALADFGADARAELGDDLLLVAGGGDDGEQAFAGGGRGGESGGHGGHFNKFRRGTRWQSSGA